MPAWELAAAPAAWTERYLAAEQAELAAQVDRQKRDERRSKRFGRRRRGG